MNRYIFTKLKEILYCSLKNIVVICWIITAFMICVDVMFLIRYNSELSQFRRRPVKPIVYHVYESKISCLTKEMEPEHNLLAVNETVTHDKRIFFLETSCKGGLDSKQACAIESAARMNPDWRIEVVFFSPPHVNFLKGDLFKSLQKTNLFYSRANLSVFLKDNPMSYLLATDRLLRLTVAEPTKLLADLMKLAALWKYGGLYLDLDTVTVSTFNSLPPNWVIRLNEKISSNALRMSKNTPFMMELMRYLIEYRKNTIKKGSLTEWIDSVFKSCPQVENETVTVCDSVPIVENVLHEVNRLEAHARSRNCSQYFPSNTTNYYAYHIPSFEYTVTAPVKNTSCYAALAKKFCPRVFRVYGKEFGL